MERKGTRNVSIRLLAVLLALAPACTIVQPAEEAALAPAGFTPTSTPFTDAPTPEAGGIHGVLWHEICKFTGGEGGEPVVLEQGCVQWGSESYEFGPNQVYDSFETGWEGVTLHLGAGACPSTGLAIAITDGNGEFTFDGLSAGTYCISYSAQTDGNDGILLPGGPTFPERSPDGYFQTVDLAAGEIQQIRFGFAWQWFN